MAMQQIICASSSSSLKKYDVFISFRGEDTRKKFTSHLYDALNKKVLTFIDENELQKGDEISSALIKAIEEAYASVVIFSQDYASSKWCLNELVKILDCKKDRGQIVIPVFYEVDPSHVRNQNGSYKKAFEKYERDLKHNKDKLQKWRNALTEAANLSGWHFQNDRNESNFIKEIVEDVLKQLNRTQPVDRKLVFFRKNERLVGIEKKYEEVESLMEIGSNDVKTLVLWGMGGIGKTTLAEYVYAKLSSQYERRCFLKNIREESTRHGLSAVCDKLVSTLLRLRLDAPYIETPIFISRLAYDKSLIVLDDVATIEQAENLNIVNNHLGPGSRVLVTTRDMRICAQFDEGELYEVEGLENNESLELLCWSAFRKNHPKEGYEALSKIAVSYCGGNPLALKVLGANFGTKSKEVWASELEKLKKIPNRRIYDVLKLSFDDLDRTQQDIFLDLACFFSLIFPIGRAYLTNLFDACNFFAVSGLVVLLDKALIYIDRYDENGFKMDNLLVETGREIVKQESPKDPGRRSRLWDPKEVLDVLKYNKGTEFVEGIYFDISEIGDVYLSSDSFKSMINLRCLHITNYISLYEEKYKKCHNIVHFLEGLEWLPDKLSHLYWDSFPLESLPSNFCAEKLVQLAIKYSKLKKLWDGIQKLDNLMIIDLSHSEDLIEIPDLSLAPKLEQVYLFNCVSLIQLHPSIFTAPKLNRLYLNGCKKIESLKTNIHLKSLDKLDLSHCSSLVEFSVTSEEMIDLRLYGTSIHEFPSSIWRSSKLRYLDLHQCNKLNIVGNKLSNDPGFQYVEYLNLSGCTQINTLNLWLILDGTQSLKKLYLEECCNLEALPDNIQNNSMLENLYLDECRKLKSLPKLPSSLQELRAVNCTNLDTNSIRSVLENKLHQLQINYGPESKQFADFIFLPGSHVPYEFFDYRTTEASIAFPHIPKSDLSYFIFYFILSEGFRFKDEHMFCYIYKNKKRLEEISLGSTGANKTLISDHVLLLSFLNSNCNNELMEVESESGCDHYNFLFEARDFDYDDEEKWKTKGIKGCGVIPVYGLEHRNNSSVKIVELQSSAQVSDESDQHSELDINDLQNESSTDENEDEKEDDLNDKSSCACSIDLLLKHLLEKSKRYFS